MKLRLLSLIILFIPGLLFAQQADSVSIRWMEDGVESVSEGHQIVFPVFQGSVTTRDFASLPCYSVSYNLLSSKHVKIEVEPVLADTLFFDEPEHYSDEDLITGNWQVRTVYKNGKAEVFVLPLKKEGSNIIRLVKFNIQMEKIAFDSRQKTAAYIPDFSNESVLNTGDWYKIGITRSGIYKLGYDEFVDMGVDPGSINPKNIKIYGQYNGMLPEANSVARPDDLLENAIEVVGEGDGTFDEGDYVLFAGQGPVIWQYNPFSGKYEHKNNIYSDTTFYFLTIGNSPGKRVDTVATPADPPDQTITSFIDYATVDNDLENIAQSGKLWLGEKFTIDTNLRHFTFDFPNRLSSKNVYIKMHAVAKGVESTYFRVKVNGIEIIDSSKINLVGPNSGFYAKDVTRVRDFKDNSNTLNVEVIRDTDDKSATGWLDYLELNAECALKWRNEQMGFSNHISMGADKVNKFLLSDAPETIQIWDVTDVTTPIMETLIREGADVSFVAQGRPNQHFIAFDGTRFLKVVSKKKIANQNLHGIGSLNMVIVTPEIFLPQANALAQLHQQNDNLTSVVVTTGQIYNEFSSGMQDVSAIRDFIRMLYLKGSFGEKPGYLMFVGDASFDYKNRVPGNNNMIATYESAESLRYSTSFATDDFFGLLDEDEGLNVFGELDIGIGRLPVSTTEQADVAVNKIKLYTSHSGAVMRDWRNAICFIADDQNMNLHLNQAEGLTSIVDTALPDLNINKIYCDAYPRVKISGGYRYPDVNKAIIKQVEEGALIVNYTGHGGLNGWAEERILDMPVIRGFSNINQLPLFITATCEFSRFDDPLFQSAGELVFLNEHGGGIALLTTTRLAYAHANIALNSRIYLNIKNTEGNELPRLGDLIRMSKIPSSNLFLNFILLGDPALKLAFPTYNVVTTSIQNGAGKTTDTVQAMSEVTVQGEIRNNGSVVDNFNGYLYPKVFDKLSVYTTRGNDPTSFKQDFTLLDKLLYSGKVTVTNGHFEFSFLVPKEIAYQYGKGKISYYALDTANFVDASGNYKDIVIGGTDPDFVPDNQGPEITMFMNDAGFENGSVVNKNSTLYAYLNDPDGISYTGLNIGRDIVLIIDDDFANAEVINSSFVPDIDSYTSGKIVMPFTGLEPGEHSLTLRAWDLQGNSSAQHIYFVVNSNSAIGLNNVLVYPNPFSEDASIRFYNKKGGEDLKVEINIYNLTGQLLGQMRTEVIGAGKEVEIPFQWQTFVNKDNNPGSGVFVYELIVSDNIGSTEITRGKMIKLAD